MPDCGGPASVEVIQFRVGLSILLAGLTWTSFLIAQDLRNIQSSDDAICMDFSLVSSHVSVLSAWPMELVPRVSRQLQPVYLSDGPSLPEAGGFQSCWYHDRAERDHISVWIRKWKCAGWLNPVTKMAHAQGRKIRWKNPGDTQPTADRATDLTQSTCLATSIQ